MATRATTKPQPARTKELGAITGVNHLVLVCKDMDETVKFYCGILGLKIRTTLDPQTTPTPGQRGGFARGSGRFYWLELGNGDIVALLEDRQHDTTPDPSFAAPLWPVPRPIPPVARKMDHLALNVDTLEDLKALRQKLLDARWPVSSIDYRPNLVHSIYFYDPNGMPLEAATWARPGDGAPVAAPGAQRTLT